MPSSLQAALDNKNSIRALAPAAVSAWILYHFETALMLGGMRVTLKMGVKKGRAGRVFYSVLLLVFVLIAWRLGFFVFLIFHGPVGLPVQK